MTTLTQFVRDMAGANDIVLGYGDDMQAVNFVFDTYRVVYKWDGVEDARVVVKEPPPGILSWTSGLQLDWPTARQAIGEYCQRWKDDNDDER